MSLETISAEEAKQVLGPYKSDLMECVIMYIKQTNDKLIARLCPHG